MPQKDEFGRHELLDRASLLSGLVAEWLVEHGGIEPDEKELAEKASQALYDLYQLLGEKTL